MQGRSENDLGIPLFIMQCFSWLNEWRWQSLGAAAAVLALALVGAWAGFTGGESATVTESLGGVTGNPQTNEYKTGDVLHPGGTIRTGAYGYMKFSYRDGSVVELGANTVCELTNHTMFSGKALRLDVGSLLARIAKQPASRRMTFTTPHAIATIVGTALRFTVTPTRTEINVQVGKIIVEAKGIREVISTGESITVQDGVFEKRSSKQAVGEDLYEDGDLLFLDTFQDGLKNWTVFRKHGTLAMIQNSKKNNPDAKVVDSVRNGIKKQVALLTSHANEGRRTAIVAAATEKNVNAFSISYDYTFDGNPRHAMEGIELDGDGSDSTLQKMDVTFPQMARPPGEWNSVRWELVKKTDSKGKPYWDDKLIFNGELIGRRSEYGHPEDQAPGVALEVTDGQLRFDNVQIRELKKLGESAGSK